MGARAYVYAGDWVADCTRPGCANAEHLFELRYPGRQASAVNLRERRRPMFHCSYCQQMDTIDWPSAAFQDGVREVMAARPLPHTRNWYPKDHEMAVRAGIPHGQSLDELRQENRANDVPAK